MYISNENYINCLKKIISDDYKLFRNKTFFITGASGLVGSFAVDFLMYLNTEYNLNINVYALFSNDESCKKRFPSYENNIFFHPIIHDINQPICSDINFDYTIHAASNTHPHLYGTQPVETIKLNIFGTANVLDLIKTNKSCKTIFLSTLEVYGEDLNISSFKESDIGYINFNKPRACYPESKRLCETLCQSYISEYDLDIRIARLGYIYGPTVKLNSSKADVQFLNNALNQQNIIMKSNGEQQRSYCYVADVISAILLILLKGEKGEVYNIAAKSGNITLKDYAQILAEIANVKLCFEIPTEDEKRGYSTVKNSTLNSEKLYSLGWNELFSCKEAINTTFQIKKEVKC